MPRFLDDNEYYLRAMEIFIEENEILKVQECLKEKNYELAMNYAFDIKSLSGSLGLAKTYEIAQRLCINLKEEKYEEALQNIFEIQNNYLKLQNL